MDKNDFTFIGIAGASGTGKTTVCEILKSSNNNYEHIKLDNYFKSPRTFPKKHGFVNWENPSNIKFNILLKHLKILASGKKVETKSFPESKKAKRKPIVLRPKKYILIEGFFLFKDKSIRDFLDKKIFIDIKPSLLLKRRMIRFGGVKDYDTKVAIPEFVRIGLNQKRFADYVINTDQPLEKVIRQVKQIIEQD